MSDYTRGTGQCPHGADAGGCPVLGCANHVQRLSSPPPPVPEVDVEAVVRQLHGMTCASAAFAGVCDGEQCDIEGAIMIGVQAGLDARGAEVERLGEQLRLANIDALNESATNAHLQERVGLLELGDKALQDRLAALEDLELSVETLELNESKRADAAEAECTRLRDERDAHGEVCVAYHEDMQRRVAALEGALRSCRWRAEEAIKDCPVKHRGTVPYTALGHLLAVIDTALSPGLPGKGES